MTEETKSTETPVIDESAEHNKITQEMYDKAARRARVFEGKLVDLEKKLEGLGDVDQVKEDLYELKLLREKQSKKGQDTTEVDELIKQAKEEARQPLLDQIKAAKEEAEQYKNELFNATVMTKARQELQELEVFRADTISVVEDLYLKNHIQKDENGNLFIVDDNKEPLYVNGEKKTIQDLANEILQKHPSFGSSKSSNNSRPSGGVTSKANIGGFDPKAYQALTDKQAKINYLREHMTATK